MYCIFSCKLTRMTTLNFFIVVTGFAADFHSYKAFKRTIAAAAFKLSYRQTWTIYTSMSINKVCNPNPFMNNIHILLKWYSLEVT